MIGHLALLSSIRAKMLLMLCWLLPTVDMMPGPWDLPHQLSGLHTLELLCSTHSDGSWSSDTNDDLSGEHFFYAVTSGSCLRLLRCSIVSQLMCAESKGASKGVNYR
jgi:hypothetical protein